MNRLNRLFALMFCLIVARNAEATEFRKILLPAYSLQPVVGADGSRFGVSANQYSSEAFVEWPVYGETPREGLIPAGPSVITLLGSPSAGRIIEVEREKYNSVSFGSTLVASDVTGQHQSRTSLPVVREDEFTTARLRLLNVKLRRPAVSGPFSDGVPVYRNTLRLYDIDNKGDIALRVRIIGNFPGLPGIIGERVVQLNRRDGNDESFPYYAQLSVNDLFESPFCFGISDHSPCPDFDFIVEVEPAAPSLSRFWGFLTLTEQGTQHVTVITPE